MTAAKRVQVLGVVLLAAGLLAAVIVFSTARREERLGILGLDVQTNRQTFELERMGGKSYLLFNDLNKWFTSLWHGRRLAYTIGVLSIAGFLSCRWFADLLEHAPISEGEKNAELLWPSHGPQHKGDASVQHFLGIYERRLRMIEKGVIHPLPKVVDGTRQLVAALRKLDLQEEIIVDATDERWLFRRSATGDLLAMIELK